MFGLVKCEFAFFSFTSHDHVWYKLNNHLLFNLISRFVWFLALPFLSLVLCLGLNTTLLLKSPHIMRFSSNNISTISTADELLKYAELYEKGLLTKEEFDLKKEELLNNGNVESNNIPEDKPNFCPNCGNHISDDESKFCINCGAKLL